MIGLICATLVSEMNALSRNPVWMAADSDSHITHTCCGPAVSFATGTVTSGSS
jgi:hypothetical protein